MLTPHQKTVLQLSLTLILSLLVFTFAWYSQSLAQGPQLCRNGMAGPYPCRQVDFISFMSLNDLGAGPGDTAANVWGWTDPQTGREYVLQALTGGLAFVDISDPVNPLLLGHLPNQTITSPTKYRDVKVYGNYAFIIADVPSRHGLQVFDLTALRNMGTTNLPATFSATAVYTGFGDAHNLFINEDSGYAYIVRATTPLLCDGAVYMLNIQDPLNPAFAGCYDQGGLASDSMCVVYNGPDSDYQGHEICLFASDDNILVADVSDKNNPVTIQDLSYPNIMRAHLAWFTEDQSHFVSADMNDEMMLGLNTRIMIWDAADLDNISLKDIYTGPSSASDHNVWVKGDYAYVGNFRAGLRILDLSAIDSTSFTDTTISEAAYFDMIPADNNAGHSGGAWAAYVYFKSGLVAVTDKEAGLYILTPWPCLPQGDLQLCGPGAGFSNTPYSFTATLNPLSGTMGTLGTFSPPLTFTWQATDQTEVVSVTNKAVHSLEYSWDTTGSKQITVTVVDSLGLEQQAYRQIYIAEQVFKVYLPLVLK